LTIQQAHKQIDFLFSTAQQGLLTPEDKDLELNWASVELFNDLKPAYGADQQLHDYLLPFEKTITLINGNTPGGLISLPSDYSHLCNIELNIIEDGNPVFRGIAMVGKDKISNSKNSQLIPPAKYPFGYYVGKKVQLHPASPVAGTLFYLKKPVECRFVYTQVGRTITYDATNSVQLEWNDEAINKLIWKVAERCGLNLQNMNATNIAMAKGGKG
jgi:hypothetical protein